MTRFRVTCGGFGVGKAFYKKGEVFEHPKDLLKSFGGKVELADAPAQPSKPAGPPPPRIPTLPPRLAAAVKKAAPAVQIEEPKVEVPVEKVEAPKVEAAKAEESKAPAKPIFGANVTDRFPEATKIHLSVYRRTNQYTVVHDDFPDKALNDKPLSKDQTTEFIKVYASE
jgi:hypothetical protein